MNKDTVIEALIERFAPLRNKFPGTIHEDAADLIRASCENIYQWGRLQGINEALEKMRGECKGEEKVRDCGYCGGNTHATKDCKYEKMEKY